MSEYFIKEGYKPNIFYRNKDHSYWNIERISKSHLIAQYQIYKFCQKLIKKNNIKSVLDIGCGKGEKLMKLIKPYCNEVYGIDEKRIIAYCKLVYYSDNFYHGDIEEGKTEINKKFDLIISSDVIEHLKNPDRLINFIKQFSHSNTLIVISTPERDILRGKNSLNPPNKSHTREWNKIEFKKYLESRNLVILYHDIVQAFRIIPLPLNYKSFIHGLLGQINKARVFRNLSRIKYNQLVLCIIKNTQNQINIKIPKLNRLHDKFKEFFKKLIFRFYLLLSYIMKISKYYNNIN